MFGYAPRCSVGKGVDCRGPVFSCLGEPKQGRDGSRSGLQLEDDATRSNSTFDKVVNASRLNRPLQLLRTGPVSTTSMSLPCTLRSPDNKASM